MHSWDCATLFVLKHKLEGWHIARKNKSSDIWIKCDWCGKLICKSKWNYDKSKHHFCNIECRDKFVHKEHWEIRKCEVCGKEFECKKISKQRFCCIKCQGKWHGEQIKKEKKDSKTEVECEYCGKKFYVRPYRVRSTKHLTCSLDCKNKLFAEITSKTEEWSKIAQKNSSKSALSLGQTRPQLKINELLDSIGIQYINEYNITYYSVDNYLPEYNLFIEVMGDFWHCSPIKYDKPLFQQQKNAIHRDRAKNTYIKNQYNLNVLYLWEKDINEDIELCKKLIIKFIQSKGVLENYNSFNYHLVGDKVVLNDNIIESYQEMDKEKRKSA